MLLYNLAAMKNSEMKVYIWNESREKQKSPAKTTLIAPELALKGNISEHALGRQLPLYCLNEVGAASTRNRPQQESGQNFGVKVSKKRQQFGPGYADTQKGVVRILVCKPGKW